MNFQFLSATFLLTVVGVVRGYPLGAPSTVCESMLPSPSAHGQPMSTGSSPYSITANKNAYSSGSSLVVTVNGNVPFKGLLVEARVGAATTALGTFSNLPANTKTIDCGGKQKNALTHTNNTLRNNVTVTWVAPTGNVGIVQFKATVVQNVSTFWTEIKSVNISPEGFNAAAITRETITVFWLTILAFCVTLWC